MTNNRRLSSVACLPVIFYIDFPAKFFVSFHQRFLHGICTMRCCIVPRRETPVFSPERGVVINTFHFVRLIREMRHAALRACFFSRWNGNKVIQVCIGIYPSHCMFTSLSCQSARACSLLQARAKEEDHTLSRAGAQPGCRPQPSAKCGAQPCD